MIIACTKKCYNVISYSTGNVIYRVPCVVPYVPLICFNKKTALVLGQNNIAYYADEFQSKANVKFDFEANKGGITSMACHDNNIIVVYETSIAVFNADTKEKL